MPRHVYHQPALFNEYMSAYTCMYPILNGQLEFKQCSAYMHDPTLNVSQHDMCMHDSNVIHAVYCA